ncbi:MAG: hypothetical protein IGS49_20100 [Chlorogloeopsis fritschii C42_A2020_084]|nr:hypothetical protein [Chlorogloeopsis fritschii C42_A2020_084]
MSEKTLKMSTTRNKADPEAMTREILADYEGLVKYICLSALVFEARFQ